MLLTYNGREDAAKNPIKKSAQSNGKMIKTNGFK